MRVGSGGWLRMRGTFDAGPLNDRLYVKYSLYSDFSVHPLSAAYESLGSGRHSWKVPSVAYRDRARGA